MAYEGYEPLPRPQQNCTCSVNSTQTTFSPSGGIGSVGVTTENGCAWTVAGDQSWITVSSDDIGTGNGTVNFLISPNPGTRQRTGTITIAGQILTLKQLGRKGTRLYGNYRE